MSTGTKNNNRKELHLSDQVIGQLRELLQLSLLSGTNFVDHCRNLRVEESAKTEGALILSEAYVLGWNGMAEQYQAQAQEKAKQMSSELADDASEEVSESDHEVIISRSDTGKLTGTLSKVEN